MAVLRTRIALGIAGLATALAVLPVASAAPRHPAGAATRPALVRGADISWPECPKGVGIPGRRGKGEPMPATTNTFVIVGLTNGPGFHPNPCIARELRWVRRHHMQVGAYSMTTYPTRAEKAKYAAGPYVAGSYRALHNAGYAEAAFNQRTMQRAHLVVPMVWVDVEPYTPWAPWSRNKAANRAVVSGAIQGYRNLGYQVGLYTYANGWREVVGRWRLPATPTWSTVGHLQSKNALHTCGHAGPSGGPTMVGQWYDVHRDYDLLCPAAQANPAAIFTAT